MNTDITLNTDVKSLDNVMKWLPKVVLKCIDGDVDGTILHFHSGCEGLYLFLNPEVEKSYETIEFDMRNELFSAREANVVIDMIRKNSWELCKDFSPKDQDISDIVAALTFFDKYGLDNFYDNLLTFVKKHIFHKTKVVVRFICVMLTNKRLIDDLYKFCLSHVLNVGCDFGYVNALEIITKKYLVHATETVTKEDLVRVAETMTKEDLVHATNELCDAFFRDISSFEDSHTNPNEDFIKDVFKPPYEIYIYNTYTIESRYDTLVRIQKLCDFALDCEIPVDVVQMAIYMILTIINPERMMFMSEEQFDCLMKYSLRLSLKIICAGSNPVDKLRYVEDHNVPPIENVVNKKLFGKLCPTPPSTFMNAMFRIWKHECAKLDDVDMCTDADVDVMQSVWKYMNTFCAVNLCHYDPRLLCYFSMCFSLNTREMPIPYEFTLIISDLCALKVGELNSSDLYFFVMMEFERLFQTKTFEKLDKTFNNKENHCARDIVDQHFRLRNAFTYEKMRSDVYKLIRDVWKDEDFVGCELEWYEISASITTCYSKDFVEECDICGTVWTDSNCINVSQDVCHNCDTFIQPCLANPINKRYVVMYLPKRIRNLIYNGKD